MDNKPIWNQLPQIESETSNLGRILEGLNYTYWQHNILIQESDED